jgi:hypothetical protein
MRSTTLPTCLSTSSQAPAAAISSSGEARSMTGRSRPFAQRRQRVAYEPRRRFGALRRRPQPVVDAVEVKAPLGEEIDIELALL